MTDFIIALFPLLPLLPMAFFGGILFEIARGDMFGLLRHIRKVADLQASLAAERAELSRYRGAVNEWNRKNKSPAPWNQHAAQYKRGGAWDRLGIAPTNDVDVILRAFREKAKKAHPDHGGSTWAFQLLFEARNEALTPAGKPVKGRAA